MEERQLKQDEIQCKVCGRVLVGAPDRLNEVLMVHLLYSIIFKTCVGDS